jgi:antitoxin (DNA-binding transcriptional repressor) of toxin-antitoxin stability system
MLKNKLNRAVRSAAGGETIVVTDRGRAVAKIVPPRRKSESIVERSVREGWLTRRRCRFDRRRRASRSPVTPSSNCWPISIATEKNAGDLHRQLGSACRPVRRAEVPARNSVELCDGDRFR